MSHSVTKTGLIAPTFSLEINHGQSLKHRVKQGQWAHVILTMSGVLVTLAGIGTGPFPAF